MTFLIYDVDFGMIANMKFHLSLASRNKKTGPIPVSTSSKETCPDSCPFKGSGCYAGGGPLNIHWKKVSNGERGVEFGKFCQQISRLPKNQIWRFNMAGDLMGLNNWINFKELKQLVSANKGRKGFTYTHKPVLVEDVNGPFSNEEKQVIAENNRKSIKFANDNGFTINLSANSPKHALKLKKLGIGPVVSVVSQNFETKTIENQKFVVCPATKQDSHVTCANCQLCQKTNRGAVVSFPAHGFASKKVEEISQNY